MSSSKEFTMVFEYENATKNTCKYAEKPEPGQPPRIGSLYIQKWALRTDTAPAQIDPSVETGHTGLGQQEA